MRRAVPVRDRRRLSARHLRRGRALDAPARRVAGAARARLRGGGAAARAFGRIRVGNDTLIGLNAIILPGTTIGARCVIGAGAVVLGTVPDGAVYAGNPAQRVGSTDELLARRLGSAHRLDLWGLPEDEREARLRAHFGL